MARQCVIEMHKQRNKASASKWNEQIERVRAVDRHLRDHMCELSGIRQ